MISVVCPFFNEELVLEKSVELMLRSLSGLRDEWELIIVDDGSIDASLKIARDLESIHFRLRVVSYQPNRGRGFAIRQGVAQAKGELVVTTEIDCSWGDDIVHRIKAEFEKHPDADVVVASPHLPGGGYRNVPGNRVFLSSIGNRIIRAASSSKITMHTGMTRGYRREAFLALPLEEDDKEMHLEVIRKALALGYRVYEIPAILEWKAERLAATQRRRRKSSARVNKLIRTHLLFSLLVAPFRYIFAVSAILGVCGLILFALAVYSYMAHTTAIYYALLSLFLTLFAFLVFAIGLLGHQQLTLQRELWHLRSAITKISQDSDDRALIGPASVAEAQLEGRQPIS